MLGSHQDTIRTATRSTISVASPLKFAVAGAFPAALSHALSGIVWPDDTPLSWSLLGKLLPIFCPPALLIGRPADTASHYWECTRMVALNALLYSVLALLLYFLHRVRHRAL